MAQSCGLPSAREQDVRCPVSGTLGRTTALITLKALLTPEALAILEPGEAYRFCPDAGCDVVYYSRVLTYHRADVRVPVYQKETKDNVPVCYCFGWTRGALLHARQMDEGQQVVQEVRAHVRAGRCGCEVNNPQGSCCLGNLAQETGGGESA